MKRRVLPVLLAAALMLPLAACSEKEEPIPSDCGDVYRAPYFDEVYDLYSNIAIFEVTVDRVLEHTYHLDWWSEVEYIVMEATVGETFYNKAPSVELAQGDPILLWTDISAHSDSTAALQELFASAESLIICGTGAGHWNNTVSEEEHLRWEEDYSGETIWEETEKGFVPRGLPQCIYFDISNWGALPMIDGCFDTQGIIDALALSDYGENFSLAAEDGDHGLYFKAGDAAEDVRDALRRYVED